MQNCGKFRPHAKLCKLKWNPQRKGRIMDDNGWRRLSEVSARGVGTTEFGQILGGVSIDAAPIKSISALKDRLRRTKGICILFGVPWHWPSLWELLHTRCGHWTCAKALQQCCNGQQRRLGILQAGSSLPLPFAIFHTSVSVSPPANMLDLGETQNNQWVSQLWQGTWTALVWSAVQL